jgi:hypothetical protein
MSYAPNMIEQVAALRHRELLDEAASRRVPRKRSRLLALASAARRSIARPTAPAPSAAVATASRPVAAS